mmetsp:Transcript_11388/g.30164  ORF Transcript_11388/g.30164 Transcript_11388/m.30164 type:complete len:140 (+) Transcript_11388:3679-4098(+)
MPNVGGVQVIEYLRLAGIGVPVVVVSGSVMTEEVAAYASAGASNVLGKPFGAKQVASIANQYLMDATSSPLSRVQRSSLHERRLSAGSIRRNSLGGRTSSNLRVIEEKLALDSVSGSDAVLDQLIGRPDALNLIPGGKV